MNVLVTGAAGYIGSHAVQRLLRDGHTVVGVDNLYRGHRRAIELVRAVAPDRFEFIACDINDRARIVDAMRRHAIDTVMHFAALAYVGESVEQPLRYARDNIAGLVSVLEAMEIAGATRLVFSSSCATYGQPSEGMIPVPEHCPRNPVSPYGRTKLVGEWMIEDFAAGCAVAGKPFAYALLRYFNVCGCDRSGVLGEDHTPESHIIPVLIQCALGQRDRVDLFGTDYDTPDGTCVRDYVHVEDLIDAHALAMARLTPGDQAKSRLVYNVGIGRGYSVREIIDAVRRVTGHPIPTHDQPRRPGDAPALYADPSRIAKELGWKASVTSIDEIVASAWRWFKAHPTGYRA